VSPSRFKLLPSGVLYPHLTPVIRQRGGHRPRVLLAEIDTLASRGVDTSRLRISAAPT